MEKWMLVPTLALCVALALLPGLMPSEKNVGKETKAKPARTVPAFQDSSAEKASFSIQEAAAGAFSGQPTGELSTVSSMDIMCAPNGIAAAQDGALFVTDIYNKVI